MPYQDISKLGQRREPDPKTFSALAAEALAKDPEWIYGNVLPIAKNREDGSYSAALPGFLRDYLSGWADLITGPSVGENLSPQAVLSILGPGATASATSPSMVIGPGARTFDRLAAYVNPFHGGDRIPRNVIPDTLSELLPIKDLAARTPTAGADIPAFRLANIFRHPDLYDAYPDIKELIVGVDKNINPNFRGQYIPSVDYISLNPNASQESIHGTLLHELQHAIQQRENFSSGGNPANFLPQDFPVVKEFLEHWIKKAQDPKSLVARNEVNQFSPLIQEVWDMNKKAHSFYTRLPGEAEARAVQTTFHGYQPREITAPSWASVDNSPEMTFPELNDPYRFLDVYPRMTEAFNPQNRLQYSPSLSILADMLRERLAP